MAKQLKPSVIGLQRNFLAMVVDVAPNAVMDLFNQVLDPFNALREFPLKIWNAERSYANLVTFGLLDADGNWGAELGGAMNAVHRALTDWGKNRGLRPAWCYEHAINAMRSFAGGEINIEAVRQAWKYALRILDEKVEKESSSPESRMLWRNAVFGSSRALVENLPPIEPPEPRAGFPPRAVRFNPPATREEYERVVKAAFAEELNKGLTAHLEDDSRKKLAEKMFNQRRDEFRRYCDEYDEHLIRFGWEPEEEIRDFDRGCRWLILYLCEEMTDGEIADIESDRTGKAYEDAAIRKARKRLAKLIEFGQLPTRRGRRRK